MLKYLKNQFIFLQFLVNENTARQEQYPMYYNYEILPHPFSHIHTQKNKEKNILSTAYYAIF